MSSNCQVFSFFYYRLISSSIFITYFPTSFCIRIHPPHNSDVKKKPLHTIYHHLQKRCSAVLRKSC